MKIKRLELVLSLNGLPHVYSSTSAFGLMFKLKNGELLKNATEAIDVGAHTDIHPKKSCTFKYTTTSNGEITGYITISAPRLEINSNHYTIHQASYLVKNDKAFEENGYVTGTSSMYNTSYSKDGSEIFRIYFDKEIDVTEISWVPVVQIYQREGDGAPLSYINCYDAADNEVYSNKNKPFIFESWKELWSSAYTKDLPAGVTNIPYNHYTPCVVQLEKTSYEVGTLQNPIKSSFIYKDENNDFRQVTGLSAQQEKLLASLSDVSDKNSGLDVVLQKEVQYTTNLKELKPNILYLTPIKKA